MPLGLLHEVAINAEIGSLGDSATASSSPALALAVLAIVGHRADRRGLLHRRRGDLADPSQRGQTALPARDRRYGQLRPADRDRRDLRSPGRALGWSRLVVPGVLAFVWLGLAAPVVEIEHRGIRAAFRRSVELVRGKFFLVAFVLIPIEIAGDALTDLDHRPRPRAASAARWVRRVGGRRPHQRRLHPLLRRRRGAADGRPDPRKGRRGGTASEARAVISGPGFGASGHSGHQADLVSLGIGEEADLAAGDAHRAHHPLPTQTLGFRQPSSMSSTCT